MPNTTFISGGRTYTRPPEDQGRVHSTADGWRIRSGIIHERFTDIRAALSGYGSRAGQIDPDNMWISHKANGISEVRFGAGRDSRGRHTVAEYGVAVSVKGTLADPQVSIQPVKFPVYDGGAADALNWQHRREQTHISTSAPVAQAARERITPDRNDNARLGLGWSNFNPTDWFSR